MFLRHSLTPTTSLISFWVYWVMYSYGFIRCRLKVTGLFCVSVVRRLVGEGGFCYWKNSEEQLHVFSYRTNFANLDSFLLWGGGYEILGLCLTCSLNLFYSFSKFRTKLWGLNPGKPKQQICAAWLETMDIRIAVIKLEAFSNQNFMSSFPLLCTVHSVAVGTGCKVNANFLLLRSWNF